MKSFSFVLCIFFSSLLAKETNKIPISPINDTPIWFWNTAFNLSNKGVTIWMANDPFSSKVNLNCSTTINGGRHWSFAPKLCFFQHYNACINPKIAINEQGYLLCFWHNKLDNSYNTMRSTDLGITWSKPETIILPNMLIATENYRIAQNDSSVFLAVKTYDQPDFNQIVLLRSDNFGYRWYITNLDVDVMDGFIDHFLAVDNNYHVLVLWYKENGFSYQTSNNYGKSWKDEEKIPVHSKIITNSPQFSWNAQGHAFLAWAESEPVAHDTMPKESLYIVSSADFGAQWTLPKCIAQTRGTFPQVKISLNESGNALISFTEKCDVTHTLNTIYCSNTMELSHHKQINYVNPSAIHPQIYLHKDNTGYFAWEFQDYQSSGLKICYFKDEAWTKPESFGSSHAEFLQATPKFHRDYLIPELFFIWNKNKQGTSQLEGKSIVMPTR